MLTSTGHEYVPNLQLSTSYNLRVHLLVCYGTNWNSQGVNWTLANGYLVAFVFQIICSLAILLFGIFISIWITSNNSFGWYNLTVTITGRNIVCLSTFNYRYTDNHAHVQVIIWVMYVICRSFDSLSKHSFVNFSNF